MAAKLDIPFTPDLFTLKSNSAISDALIEKAVAAGKTESQINAAMATLWRIMHFWLFKLKNSLNSLALSVFVNFNFLFLYYYNNFSIQNVKIKQVIEWKIDDGYSCPWIYSLYWCLRNFSISISES